MVWIIDSQGNITDVSVKTALNTSGDLTACPLHFLHGSYLWVGTVYHVLYKSFLIMKLNVFQGDLTGWFETKTMMRRWTETETQHTSLPMLHQHELRTGFGVLNFSSNLVLTANFFLIMKITGLRGERTDVKAKTAALVSSRSVLPFSKLNKLFFGYFDLENIFIDNENK